MNYENDFYVKLEDLANQNIDLDYVGCKDGKIYVLIYFVDDGKLGDSNDLEPYCNKYVILYTLSIPKSSSIYQHIKCTSSNSIDRCFRIRNDQRISFNFKSTQITLSAIIQYQCFLHLLDRSIFRQH